MALRKIKLGELIELSERYNTDEKYGMDYVRGISNAKQIMMSKADVDPDVIRKFYIVDPGEFIYNPRTTRMGEKVGMGYNNTSSPLLFSFNNIAFKIKDDAASLVVPEYLYMFYNRPEFDRYAIVHSWGSATELFSFEEMCDIDIELPDIDTQKKFVNVYLALLKNQNVYELGLDDLNNTIGLFFDRVKRAPSKRIGDIIAVVSEKNTDFSIPFSQLRGINEFGEFTPTRDSIGEEDVDKYLIINNKCFAVNFMCLGNFGKFYLAYNDFNETYLVSPACNSFRILANDVDPYYLLYVLQRSEFQRKCVFLGDGNTRGGINITDFSNIEIPVPSFKDQKIISNLYRSYENRRIINDSLKKQIKDICPILIKGSIEEAR